MKISGIPDNVRSLYAVREKREGENADQGKKDQQNQKDPKEEFQAELEVSQKKIEDAVDSFQHDSQAQAAGLAVSIAGAGPGLRVILKDGSGGVVRQFTGEEFIKLRQSVGTLGKDTRASGKLLDRKL